MSAVEDRLAELGLSVPDVATPAGGLCAGRARGQPRLHLRSAADGVRRPLADRQSRRRATDWSPPRRQGAGAVCALNAIAAVKSVIGDLDQVTRVVKVVGFVASRPVVHRAARCHQRRQRAAGRRRSATPASTRGRRSAWRPCRSTRRSRSRSSSPSPTDPGRVGMAVRDFAPGVLGPQAAEWLAGRRSEPVEPRYAATVMLVRDGSGAWWPGRRCGRRGVHAAPGGHHGVRAADMGVPRRRRGPARRRPRPAVGRPAAAGVGRPMGCEEGLARALVCAAVREVFEECGVLLAGPSPETVVADLRDPEWDVERAALLSKEQSFAELLSASRTGAALRPALAAGRWVTPDFEPRRYDTSSSPRSCPRARSPMTHTTEADHADWTDPAELLAAYEMGEAMMLPPTVVSVERVLEAAAPPSSSRPRSRRGRSSPARRGGRPADDPGRPPVAVALKSGGVTSGPDSTGSRPLDWRPEAAESPTGSRAVWLRWPDG